MRCFPKLSWVWELFSFAVLPFLDAMSSSFKSWSFEIFLSWPKAYVEGLGEYAFDMLLGLMNFYMFQRSHPTKVFSKLMLSYWSSKVKNTQLNKKKENQPQTSTPHIPPDTYTKPTWVKKEGKKPQPKHHKKLQFHHTLEYKRLKLLHCGLLKRHFKLISSISSNA